jgi:hypothetical protein
LVGLIYVAVVLVEIFLVGSVLVALTTWPLWRRLKKLERERDAKAREILERWRPVEPARAELSFSTKVSSYDWTGRTQVGRRARAA